MQYKGLVACRAGVGSSLMLKIKLNQVIKEHDLPLKIEHGSLDAIAGFNGEVIITLSDVAKELVAKKLKQKIIGIDNIMNKTEIFDKLENFFDEETAKE
jgi:PTS system ascorbate-specific IIB component